MTSQIICVSLQILHYLLPLGGLAGFVGIGQLDEAEGGAVVVHLETDVARGTAEHGIIDVFVELHAQHPLGIVAIMGLLEALLAPRRGTILLGQHRLITLVARRQIAPFVHCGEYHRHLADVARPVGRRDDVAALVAAKLAREDVVIGFFKGIALGHELLHEGVEGALHRNAFELHVLGLRLPREGKQHR